MSPRKKVDEFRKIYLLLYNMFQFVGFLYILIILSIEYSKEGPASMEKAYQSVGFVMQICQLMQFLEILHPMLGYTGGRWQMPFCQVCGRALIIFGLINSEPRMYAKPVVFYLMYTYSLVEVFRYPYYMLRIYDVDVGLVTWMRYSVWVPLYPAGFLCEGVVILRSIPYAEETERFSLPLPNALNFSFHFPLVLRLYLLFGLFPAMYFMMTYMYGQRKRVLDTTKEGQD